MTRRPALAVVAGFASIVRLDPVHDAAGNTVFAPKPGAEAAAAQALNGVYDAWNRLAAVYSDDGATSGQLDGSDTLVATCRYDGRGRRIRKTVESTEVTYDYYYSGYQVVEVRKDGDADPLEQYVWDGRYVHSPCLRWRDADENGSLEETLYYTGDANFNVTSLVEPDGDVVERVIYDPYGQPTFYDGAWANPSASSAYANEILFTGHRLDPETGLYYCLMRHYHPAMGRWLQRDPIGYDGAGSLYQYVMSMPLLAFDPMGLDLEYGVLWPQWKECRHPGYKMLKPDWEQFEFEDGGSVEGALSPVRVALILHKAAARPWPVVSQETSITALPEEPQCQDGETKGEEFFLKTYYIKNDPFWAADWNGDTPPDKPRVKPAVHPETGVPIPYTGGLLEVEPDLEGHPPSKSGTTRKIERQYHWSRLTVERWRYHYCCKNRRWVLDCQESQGPFSALSRTVFYKDHPVTTTVTVGPELKPKVGKESSTAPTH